MNMKKTIAFLLSITFLFLLVACGNDNANQIQEIQSQGSDQVAFQGEIPLESKLVFGSFMLEETDMAITPEQAEELLPLWKLFKTLIESDTTADAELAAVVDSIQDAMKADQMDYIDTLQLGGDTMRQLMDDLGIGFGFRGGEGEEGEIPEGFTPPGRLGGVPGQGAGGGQGLGPGGGFENLSPEQQETAQAMREERGGDGRRVFANPALMDALIELLEGKIE
jgi:hypothetical protein